MPQRVAILLLGSVLLAASGLLAPAQEPRDTRESRGQPRNQTAFLQIGPLEFHGHNHGERVVIGRDVTVKEGETNRELVVIFGDATIDGTLTGDLVSVLGNVTVGPTGHVRREMVVVGGRADIHPDAEFHGFSGPIVPFPIWLTGGLREWLTQGLLLGRPIPHQAGWVWCVAAAFLIVYLLVAGLLPRPVQACVTVLESKPATSFLAGMLALLLAGPLIALLVVSMVGLIVLPFLVCAMAAGFVIGRVAVIRFAGQTFGAQLGLQFLQSPIPALVIGAALLGLLYAVPILGFLAWGLVGTLGAGAALIAGGRSLRFEFPNNPTPGVPHVQAGPAGTTGIMTDATASASATEAGPDATDASLLPRMGFWIRLAATALDLLVIGILVRVFGRAAEELFLPVWILYHLILWAWKGTTVGGIVLRLRIVRLNGDPINFAVALVRCLSAFFSTLVFCLGFFWAGWSRDRQSWHDLISGTVIVRLPPGSRLV